jgi:hypothetical protein
VVVNPPDFDALYASDPDPWRVRTSFYEQRKLSVVLASLSAAHYRRSWDPACGTGELAAQLSPRCDWVLATDASAEAAQITRRRCAGLSNVEVARRSLPDPPTDHGASGPPDLVVLAEFLYYLDRDARARTLDMITTASAPVAEVMSLHWRHRAADAWLSGEDMQTEIIHTLTRLGWHQLVHHEEPDFVLDAFRR